MEPPATIEQPKLVWSEDGTPRSVTFDDIYFSSEDGLAETEHVFLNGNRLAERFANCRTFTVGETGFGTGLNFLCCWRLWQKTATSHGRLHFVSVEKYPLSPQDLDQALGLWSELADLSTELLSQYRPPRAGFSRYYFDQGRVVLTLLHGDATIMWRQFSGQVDAWFLDGFSPAQNPDIWSQDLFDTLACCSAPDATCATFTSAGFVRRGLAAAGFEVERTSGFGTKRHMTVGKLAPSSGRSAPEYPWFDPPKVAGRPTRVAIIGGGIAGACVAYALRQHGIEVIVFDQDPVMSGERSGASGNPAAVIMPRISGLEDIESRFFIDTFQAATDLYRSLDPSGELFRKCGVLQIARSARERQKFESAASVYTGGLPEIKFAEPDESERLSGLQGHRWGGLWFPDGGMVNGSGMCKRLLDRAGCTIHEATRITRIERHSEGWCLKTDLTTDQGADLATFEVDAVVLAGGAQTAMAQHFTRLDLPLSLGQVTFVDADKVKAPEVVLVGAGYMTPRHQPECLSIGATFDAADDAVRSAAMQLTPMDQANADNLQQVIEDGFLEHCADSVISGARSSVRVMSPDQFPLAGPVADLNSFERDYADLHHGRNRGDIFPGAKYHAGLFAISGLGSRGFVTAPLLGEMLASLICGEPLPVSRDLYHRAHPARFHIRRLRKAPHHR